MPTQPTGMTPALWIQAGSLCATILLGVAAYFVTYFNNVRVENRKARIKYVSDQLQYLYGPLFSLHGASGAAWEAFRSRYRPTGAFFSAENPPSELELQQWRLWMVEVFMPINLEMEKAIIENAHLIEGSRMPESFQEFLAHVEAYKVILRRWTLNDFREHTAYANFPRQFGPDIRNNFKLLKARQAALIEHRGRPNGLRGLFEKSH